MKKPTLVIMAAGMGSRYGGLKQIDPIDEQGHIIMDFSIYDAVRAGFEKVVFIIKKENEADFRETIGNRMEKQIEVAYAFQRLDNIPEGFEVPEGRVKPFGTGHAVLSATRDVDGPFAVINADDYYGVGAFQTIYDYLAEHGEEADQCAMVGYILKNTLTDNGYVSRGVCAKDENNHLVQIDERTRIIKTETGAAYSEDEGKTWIDLPADSTVSMNLWGFSANLIQSLVDGFPGFLTENLPKNPMKCEYLLPATVGQMLKRGEITVNVLQSPDKWYGVTYKEDKPEVVKALKGLKDSGLYPEKLWE